MTYDNTDSNSDGVIDAPVDNDSVSTGNASIGPNSRDWGDEIQPIVVVGQSNASGRGDSTASANLPADVSQVYKNDNLTPLEDPVCSESDPDADGSAWPAFAKRFYELTQTPTAFVSSALGSTALVEAAGDGTGNWSPNGSLRSDAVSDWESLQSALDAEGYHVKKPWFIWNQGEADASGIRDGDITQSDYETELKDLISYWDSELPTGWSFILQEVGPGRNDNDDAIKSIQAAQRRVCLDTANASYVSGVSRQFGTLHFTQDQYDKLGALSAENLASGSVDVPRQSATVKISSNQQVDTFSTAGSFTKIKLDTVKYDPHGLLSVNDNAVIIQQDGEYQCSAVLALEAPPTSTPLFAKIKSSADGSIAETISHSSVSGEDLSASITTKTEQMSAGEEITLTIAHKSGSTETVSSLSGKTYLTVSPVNSASSGL